MYPFMITWQKEYFGSLNFFNKYGYVDYCINFWYPIIRIGFLEKQFNFVTDEPKYPDLSAPWHRHLKDKNEWDEIPF